VGPFELSKYGSESPKLVDLEKWKAPWGPKPNQPKKSWGNYAQKAIYTRGRASVEKELATKDKRLASRKKKHWVVSCSGVEEAPTHLFYVDYNPFLILSNMEYISLFSFLN
jgi:hypothetical protein